MLFELPDIDIRVLFSLSTFFPVSVIEHAITQRTNLYGSTAEYVIAYSLFRVHSLPGTEIIAVKIFLLFVGVIGKDIIPCKPNFSQPYGFYARIIQFSFVAELSFKAGNNLLS